MPPPAPPPNQTGRIPEHHGELVATGRALLRMAGNPCCGDRPAGPTGPAAAADAGGGEGRGAPKTAAQGYSPANSHGTDSSTNYVFFGFHVQLPVEKGKP